MENNEVLSDYDRTFEAGRLMCIIEDMLYGVHGGNTHEQEVIKSAKLLINSVKQILNEGYVK